MNCHPGIKCSIEILQLLSAKIPENRISYPKIGEVLVMGGHATRTDAPASAAHRLYNTSHNTRPRFLPVVAGSVA